MITATSRIEKFTRFSHLTLAISLLSVTLLLITCHDTADASILIPSRGIDLIDGHETAEGAWSDGSTMWIVADGQDKLIAYSLATGAHLGDQDIELASYNDGAQGIWSDGNTMYVADWDDKKLYGYDLDTGDRRSNRDITLASSNSAPRGIWGFNNSIWVVDKDDTYVYSYWKNERRREATLDFDLHGSNDDPWGIWGKTDGTVWVNDHQDDFVYQYSYLPSDDTQRAVLRLPLNNGTPRGLWSDGEIMWSVDDYDTYVYAMRYRDFRHKRDDVAISEVVTPRGIWTDGATMWVVDAGSTGAKLMAYNLSDESRDTSKDITLSDANADPISIWSDGTHIWVSDGDDVTLYAYSLSGDQAYSAEKSMVLRAENADPKGIWSDGELVWVTDAEDGELYAYELATSIWKDNKHITLHAANDDPGDIWSDGKHIWVFDTADKNVYAYNLRNGNRNRSVEFRPTPDNSNFSGGLTGYDLRFWVVDTEDDNLYAYGKLNTPPAFSSSSAEFKFHHSLTGRNLVGTVPEATDVDGDTLTYSLRGPDAARFSVGGQSGEVYTKENATFTTGEALSLVAWVSDGKSLLDGNDNSRDTSINITLRALHNDDPVFLTPSGATFTVAEDAAGGHVIADIETADLDEDTLTFTTHTPRKNPFEVIAGQLKLKADANIDYESRTSYDVVMRVKDGVDENDDVDPSWDDRIEIGVHVINVDEPAELALNSSVPEVDKAIVATLSEPDGVNLEDGKQINWKVERSSDSVTWTPVDNADSDSTEREYTPVEADAEMYLRFEAVYWDYADEVAEKTITTVTANTVLAAPPNNGAPTFSDGASTARSVAEDAADGGAVDTPVSATDSDADTLTYGLIGADADHFSFNASTGQISLNTPTGLDYESKSSYSVRMQVRDSKDAGGNADTGWDAYINVSIGVTNAEEAGTVTLNTDAPQVLVELIASLSDPDGSISNLAWQWQTANSLSATTWDDVNGATAAGYTPMGGDAGKFLRAQASYDDGQGTSKQAVGTVSSATLQRATNEPPTFDEGSGAVRSVSEGAVTGTAVGAAVLASDPEGDQLTYSLATGTDAAHFAVEPSAGILTVAPGAALDYEAGHSFVVVVQASDGRDANHNADSAVDASITVTINLENADEGGRVALSPTAPQEGDNVTATLTDPDGSLTGTSWQWAKSQDGVSSWSDINGASSSSYTPSSSDVGMYLRATAQYSDGEGSGKSAAKTSTDPVEAEPVPDTTLSSLSLNRISLTFDAQTLHYRVSVPNNVRRTKVSATTTATSGVTLDITPADSRPNKTGHQVDLDVGDNEIVVTVSVVNGTGSTAYTILVHRQEPRQTASDQCKEDYRNGLVAHCGANSFAAYRVELDGRYTIDWSEWASRNPNATSYTVNLREFMYQMYFDIDNDSQVSSDSLTDVYEECNFVDDRWNCQDPVQSNYYEDTNGNPTEVSTLVENTTRQSWSSSLDAPGALLAQETFHRWSGDATDANNTPTEVTYQTKTFEMDLYYFQVHYADSSQSMKTTLVNGANGFADREP